jgi:hypothetical protein
MSLTRDLERTRRELARERRRLRAAQLQARAAVAQAKAQARKARAEARAEAPLALRPSTPVLTGKLLGDPPLPTPAQALQAQRNGEARLALLEEFGAFTSEEVGERRSRAKNRHALANRWRAEGRVFAVEVKGQRLYPGFQFDPDLNPLALIGQVIAVLPREEMSDWEVALWWTADNGWLGARRPVDLIAEEGQAILEAAAHLSEPSGL